MGEVVPRIDAAALEAPLSIVTGSATETRRHVSELGRLVARASRLADEGRVSAAYHVIEGELAREGGLAPLADRVALLVEAARLLWTLGRYDECLMRARRGFVLAEHEGDGRAAADALLRQGLALHRKGDMAGARDFYSEARARFRRLGDTARAAAAQNNLGLVCKNLGDWESARTHFHEAIAAARQEDSAIALGSRLQSLGVLELKSGAWTRARAALTEARECFVRAGLRWQLTSSDLALGFLARLEHRGEEAASLARQARDRALGEHLPREEAIALELSGDLLLDAGDPSGASRVYHAALQIAERVAPESDLACEIIRRIAHVVVLEGDLSSARAWIDRARALAQELADPYELALIGAVDAERALAGEEFGAAQELLNTSIGVLAGLGERFERGRCLTLLAQIAGNAEESCRLGFRASACFAEAGAEHELRAIEELVTGRLRAAATRAPETADQTAEPKAAARPHRGGSAFPALPRTELVGPSRAFARVRVKVSRASRNAHPVLLRGEAGVGKDLIARLIHERSPRATGPFVVVRCQDVAPDQLSAHLYGEARPGGSVPESPGWLARAHGGTLYIDDIGRMPLATQSALLRFLQRGQFLRVGDLEPRSADVRIVASTRQDLRNAADQWGFRRDLLTRFALATIDIPALRARREDILPLARHFLRLCALEAPPTLDDGAAVLLIDQPWFENARELEECMREALVEVGPKAAVIDRDVLARLLDRADPSHASTGDSESGETQGTAGGGRSEETSLLHARLNELERQRILHSLSRVRGNKTRAAAALGIARKTLYEKMRRLGISKSGG